MANQQINKPTIINNLLGAELTPTLQEQKVLIVGQQTSTATATEKTLITNLQSIAQVETLFGKRSELAGIYRAFRAINSKTQVDAISLDDAGAGVAATGSVAFVASTPEAGSLTISVGSVKNHSYTIDIVATDTATTIGDKLEAAVTADTEAPFTAANVTGTVTFTHSQKGTIGNNITLSVQGIVNGVTVTLTEFASGATDPTVTGLYSVIGETRYQNIVAPDYAQTETLALLDNRWNIDNKVLNGIMIYGKIDTLANLKTLLTSINSQNLVVFGNKLGTASDFKGSETGEFNYVISADLAAVRSLRLTEDANLSDIVSGNVGILDRSGGISLASLPYFNTPLSNISPILSNKGFTGTEIDELRDTGISAIGNNKADNGVLIGELVTAYKTDTLGNPDTSFKFLNFRDTYDVATEYQFNNLKVDYDQSRLTQGDLRDGLTMANEDSFRGSMLQYYKELSSLGITVAGKTDEKYYNDNLTILVDTSTRKVTMEQQIPIVTQFGNMVITSRVAFNVG
jgi:phage tail sheath gpL-like